MGKIVALGGGLYENGEMLNVVKHIIELTNKKAPSFLYVPTAGHDCVDDGDRAIWECFAKNGCSDVNIMFLSHPYITEELVREKVKKADIVYVGGGNLEFLINTWNKTGASRVFKEAFYEGKVLCGVSSGAMCWFKEGYDDCGENGSFMFCDCLDLIPFTSAPHFEHEHWQTFKTAILGRGLSGIGMDNGAAFCAVDGKYYTLSGAEGGDCYFYDAENNYSETNLSTLDEKALNAKLTAFAP